MVSGLGVLQLFTLQQPRCCYSSVLDLPPVDPPTPGFILPARYAGRVQYTAAVQLEIAAGIASLMVGVYVGLACRTVRRTKRAETIFLLLLFGIVAGCSVITPRLLPAVNALMQHTIACECPTLPTFQLWEQRGTAAVAVLLVGVAGLLLTPMRGSVRRQAQAIVARERMLSYLLAVGTVLLAASVLRISALAVWITSYFAKDDQPGIQALMNATAATWGMYYSLFLAATYVPTLLVLRTRLRAIAASIDQHAPPIWYDKALFTASPLQEIGSVVGILTPVLVGEAAKLLEL
jgi:hypothetical protein